MSITAAKWAYKQNIKSPCKPVLVALADHANDKDFTAWPSVECLAFETGMSKATIMRATKKLGELGLISKKFTKSSKGQRWYNTYALNLNINEQASNMQDCIEQDSKLSNPGIIVQAPSLHGDTETIIEPSINHQNMHPSASVARPEAISKDCLLQIVETFNKVLPELPSIKVLSDKRKQALQNLIARHKSAKELSWWNDYFEKVKDSAFLMGKSSKWRANFDFLIRYDNMLKIIEGTYE